MSPWTELMVLKLIEPSVTKLLRARSVTALVQAHPVAIKHARPTVSAAHLPIIARTATTEYTTLALRTASFVVRTAAHFTQTMFKPVRLLAQTMYFHFQI